MTARYHVGLGQRTATGRRHRAWRVVLQAKALDLYEALDRVIAAVQVDPACVGIRKPTYEAIIAANELLETLGASAPSQKEQQSA